MKVLDLPYGKFRDKGQPIDNVSNYDSTQEEIVYICDSEQMRFARILFATRAGMIKKVPGTEFQVSKRTIAATKLQAEDAVVSVQVISDGQQVVLRTKDGYFLGLARKRCLRRRRAPWACGGSGCARRMNWKRFIFLKREQRLKFSTETGRSR